MLRTSAKVRTCSTTRWVNAPRSHERAYKHGAALHATQKKRGPNGPRFRMWLCSLNLRLERHDDPRVTKIFEQTLHRGLDAGDFAVGLAVTDT